MTQRTMTQRTMEVLLRSCSSCWIYVPAILISLVFSGHAQDLSCTGFAANGHCYYLNRVSTNWDNATEDCVNRFGGHLASIYSKNEQAALRTYLTQEGISFNHIWTSGKKPDSEIFWGNPESFWRWVGDCGSECFKTGCKEGRVDLAFVIDASGSMKFNNGWALTLQFFTSIIKRLDIGDDKVRVAIVIYSSHAEIESTKLQKRLLDSNVENTESSLKEKIETLHILDSNTDTDDVLKLLREGVFTKARGDRPNAPNVAIVLTDGKSTNTDQTILEATHTRDDGIQLFIVGVTREVIANEVRQMSSPPQIEGNTYFLVKTYDDLDAAVHNVSTQVCNWHEMLNVVNASAISTQGCYYDKHTDGLIYPDNVIVRNASVCVSACARRGFLFAGVGFINSSPDPKCWCGNEFGKGGPAAQCTKSCEYPPNNSNLCGGIDKTLVFKTDGLYGAWIYGNPNNFNDVTHNSDGEQFCGALDSRDIDVFTFVDDTCTKKYNFLCQIPMGYCENTLSRELRRRYFTLSIGDSSPGSSICVSMGVDNSEKDTWHNARRFCQNRNGDLLRVDSRELNVQLTTRVKATQTTRNELYWVGLYKESHFWIDGYVTEANWNNFADDHPQFLLGDCVYVDPNANFRWKTGNCADNKYYVCDRVTSTPGTATTANVSLVSPTAGAATTSESFWTKYWWLLLLICILLVLIIILIIVFCCYKREHPVRVGPKIYDARPIAKAPISTVLGDDDPYNYYVESSSQVDLVVGSTLHGVPKKKKWNRTIDSATGHDVYYDVSRGGYSKNRVDIN